MYKLILVAGARPNFMKIAPILRALKRFPQIKAVLVHTGQHYDQEMSKSFFTELDIPAPDYNLNVGSGSHAIQTATIMTRFETVCLREKPNMVLVVGDVNSTIAAGLVAKKLLLDLCHVEAGLRSGDRTMPEEINRIATDAISDLFFTTEESGSRNLLREGVSSNKIHFVGHVMIDNLLYQLDKMNYCGSQILQTFPFKKMLPAKYICLTLHRPSNVDSKETLSCLLTAISKLADRVPVIFPCHPRTRKQIEIYGMMNRFKLISDDANVNTGIYLLNPMGYNEFLYLWKKSVLVLTDSGGMQEETTALGIPCITLRENTERSVTVEIGTNEIIGNDLSKIVELGDKAIQNNWKKGAIPKFWDGKASERITEVIASYS